MNQHPQTSVARGHRGHRGARALVSVTLLALALTLLVALAPAAQAKSKYADTIRDGRAAARALLEQTGAPSLSLALVSHGKVVWRQSFGYADVATKTAPTATTMYGLGSVSKTLATVAVMQLVDEGKVDLDEPLVTYLPRFRMASPGYRAVTVRMLLDHSSGFPGSAYASAWTAQFWPGYLDQVMTTLAQITTQAHPRSALGVLQRRLHRARGARPRRERAVLHRLHAERRVRSARHDHHGLPAARLRRRVLRQGLRPGRDRPPARDAEPAGLGRAVLHALRHGAPRDHAHGPRRVRRRAHPLRRLRGGDGQRPDRGRDPAQRLRQRPLRPRLGQRHPTRPQEGRLHRLDEGR